MDRIRAYRGIIKKIIADYAQCKPSYGEVQVETIFDAERDHYQRIYEGWKGVQRMHGSVMHVALRRGKVGMQQDGTEDGIAEARVAAGIPRDCAGVSRPREAAVHCLRGGVRRGECGKGASAVRMGVRQLRALGPP